MAELDMDRMLQLTRDWEVPLHVVQQVVDKFGDDITAVRWELRKISEAVDEPDIIPVS